ncbi:hypothetical protein BKA70DRAFT_1433346 [Coprinopsis sp. MPI-PUGE-AT-0042]|nr:hypothetical protein BKA70DRAFT_1433346 [Coprinopsis sp. MPI-PUGE-AT-0042]
MSLSVSPPPSRESTAARGFNVWARATAPMARGKRGKHGTITHQRGIIQGSNGFTINGGNYNNGDASTTTTTTIQYNLLVVNLNGSSSLTVSASNALSLAGLFGYPSTTGV